MSPRSRSQQPDIAVPEGATEPPLTPGSMPKLGPAPHELEARDERYFHLLASAVQKCSQYKPKLGKGRKEGLTLDEFQNLYESDPFYSWIGIASPLMYAAHKAAGGMTSIYRQIGIGAQWVFSYVLQDSLGLTKDQATFSYVVPRPSGKPGKPFLDGRIEIDDVQDAVAKSRIIRWIQDAADKLLLDEARRKTIKGVVFEVRQGYKSMDSKRQNADILNAANAYAYNYIPALVLFSTQIDAALIQRYTEGRWLLLIGSTSGSPITSTYAFCRDVIGYDLAAFYERNSPRIRAEVENVLTAILNPRSAEG